MSGPTLLRLARRFRAGVAAIPHVLQQTHAPVDAVLDAARKIRRGRRTLRPGRHQQIRKTVNQHAEEGRRRVLPFRVQRLAANAFDVDLVIGAGDGVKAGGVDDDVELVVAL